MAVRKFILTTGQSNAEPQAAYDDWRALHIELDLAIGDSLSTRASIGSYADTFSMPGGFPGYETIDLRWKAIRPIRYLTFYNPLASGYYSYPGTGRLATGQSHTSTTLYVQQEFIPGETIEIVRERDGQTYSATVATPALSVSSIDTGTEIITLSGAHGIAAGLAVRFLDGGSGDLPGVTFGKTYFVINPSGATLQVSETPGGAAVDLTGVLAGTVHLIGGNYGSILAVTGWDDPQADEQFTYKMKTIGTHGSDPTNIAIIGMFFGLFWPGDLVGLAMTCTVGAAANVGKTRIISAWNDETREVTFSETWPTDIDDDDEFTIQPQNGVPYEQHAFFLPLCPYEAATVTNHENPYPPGFEFPGQYHVPVDYGPNASLQGSRLTEKMPWHTGLASKLKAFLGHDIYVISTGIGGIALAHSEIPSDSVTKIGWFDGAAMTSLSPGESNNAFQRISDELDAAIAAAAAEGDTVECIAIFDAHGETDALSSASASRYLVNKRRFMKALRELVKSKTNADESSLWPKTAESLPWVALRLQEFDSLGAVVWPSYEEVNDSHIQLVSEDRYFRSVKASDSNYVLAHLNAAGMVEVETLMFNAFVDIEQANDQTGIVALCNLALSYIGDTANVSSIDPEDGSAQSTHCARFFDIARDAVLEMGQWQFASTRLAPTATTSEWPQWPYAYLMPSDCLKVFAVLPPEVADDNVQLPVFQPGFHDPRMIGQLKGEPVLLDFIEEIGPDGTKILYTKVENAVVRYVRRVTDARRYSASFKTALAWKLASMLTGPLGKSEDSALRCLAMLERDLPKAEVVDSTQRRVSAPHVAPWHRGR